jgi:CYTH domain-containing protein
VRVRAKGELGYLTIKGKTNENGFSRFEWEKEISLSDAEQLLELCDKFIIFKTRYEVPYKGKTFEIDVFHGLHEGLVIAELELQAENESYEKPDWLGKEVTGDVRYYNAWLSKRPVFTGG